MSWLELERMKFFRPSFWNLFGCASSYCSIQDLVPAAAAKFILARFDSVLTYRRQPRIKPGPSLGVQNEDPPSFWTTREVPEVWIWSHCEEQANESQWIEPRMAEVLNLLSNFCKFLLVIYLKVKVLMRWVNVMIHLYCLAFTNLVEFTSDVTVIVMSMTLSRKLFCGRYYFKSCKKFFGPVWVKSLWIQLWPLGNIQS